MQLKLKRDTEPPAVTGLPFSRIVPDHPPSRWTGTITQIDPNRENILPVTLIGVSSADELAHIFNRTMMSFPDVDIVNFQLFNH